jgi:hypothetical protein
VQNRYFGERNINVGEKLSQSIIRTQTAFIQKQAVARHGDARGCTKTISLTLSRLETEKSVFHPVSSDSSSAFILRRGALSAADCLRLQYIASVAN